MKVKITLDTVTAIANFVLIASTIKEDVFLVSDNGLRVNGKSFLGVAHAHEFNNLWCECSKDISSKLLDFIV